MWIDARKPESGSGFLDAGRKPLSLFSLRGNDVRIRFRFRDMVRPRVAIAAPPDLATRGFLVTLAHARLPYSCSGEI